MEQFPTQFPRAVSQPHRLCRFACNLDLYVKAEEKTLSEEGKKKVE
jgi:hypothetical protein